MARRPMIERVRERKERHRQRSKAYRIGVATAGVVLVLVGLVLSLPLVPGPGLLIVAAGVALLALESDRAERLLERILGRVERVGDAAMRAGSVERAIWIAALAAVVAAAVAAAMLWDLPLLPV